MMNEKDNKARGGGETVPSICVLSYLHNMQAPVQNANSVSPNQSTGKTHKAFCLAHESLSGDVLVVPYHHLLFKSAPKKEKKRAEALDD